MGVTTPAKSLLSLSQFDPLGLIIFGKSRRAKPNYYISQVSRGLDCKFANVVDLKRITMAGEKVGIDLK